MSHQPGHDTTSASDGQRPHKAGAFDIRNFIGALLGIYGVVLVLCGLLSHSDVDLALAGGVKINLLAGLGLLVASAVFVTWARLRPVVVSEADIDRDQLPRGH